MRLVGPTCTTAVNAIQLVTSAINEYSSIVNVHVLGQVFNSKNTR